MCSTCCVLCCVEVREEDDKNVLYLLLLVHLPGMLHLTPSPDNTHGWQVSRKLDDFHALHKELTLVAIT